MLSWVVVGIGGATVPVPPYSYNNSNNSKSSFIIMDKICQNILSFIVERVVFYM